MGMRSDLAERAIQHCDCLLVFAEQREHHDVGSISSYYVSKTALLPRAVAAVMLVFFQVDVYAATLDGSIVYCTF